jgi:hypothetical protein
MKEHLMRLFIWLAKVPAEPGASPAAKKRGFWRLRIAVALAGLLALPAIVTAQTRELATKGALLDRVAAVVNDGVVLNS